MGYVNRGTLQTMVAAPKPAELHKFHDWLLEEGLSSDTAVAYAGDVDRAHRLGDGAARLRDGELAPKTRRRLLAAFRRWAEFRGDEKLTLQLRRLGRRLPAPARKISKIPLSRDDWFAVIDEVDEADYLGDAMRAQIGMMAGRGFRCADVLRLQRAEVTRALKTGELIYVAKGSRRIRFRVLDTFASYLEILADFRRYSRVEDLISPGSTPGRSRRAAAARAVERATEGVGYELGIEGLHPHRLRRTYATEYLRALGNDPEALPKLKEHMQWASLATAMEYVDHERGVELDAVAEEMMKR